MKKIKLDIKEIEEMDEFAENLAVIRKVIELEVQKLVDEEIIKKLTKR